MDNQEIDTMYDFGGEFSQAYKGKCECGKEFQVSTQQDSDPEYHTEIFIRCDCGKSVGFCLPIK